MTEPDATGAPALVVRHADDRSRYEGRVGDELVTVIDYTQRGRTLVVTHTGTLPRWRGRGLAGRTTEAALADVRARGLTVVPVCPFTADYFDQHPEHADLRRASPEPAEGP